MYDVDLTLRSGTTLATGWNFSNVDGVFAFNCTGQAVWLRVRRGVVRRDKVGQ